MIQQSTARVIHAGRLSGDMALLVLDVPEIAACARPGQFVMVQCGNHTLRRPLSVHAADGGKLALLFRVTGGGTEWLSSVVTGDDISITGPLGNGYTLPESGARVLLIGGGVGIAPLHFLAMRLPERCDVTLVYGARCATELYRSPEELRTLIPGSSELDSVNALLATDDGSAGVHGVALDVALPLIENVEHVYLCGPVGMCVAASRLTTASDSPADNVQVRTCSPSALARLAEAQVSLEVRMGCGVGACYSCSISTRTGRKKVCMDGPVFRFGDVCWEEVVT